MKKVFLFLGLFFLMGNVVLAFQATFDINVDNITLASKSNNLFKQLDDKYEIDVKDFSNTISNDEDIDNFVKEILKLSLNNDNSSLLKILTPYMFVDKDNGHNTLSANVFLQMYIDQLAKDKIQCEYINSIRSVETENGTFVFVYSNEATVNDESQDVIFVYWLKEVDGSYKLFFPWITFEDDLRDYFDEITKGENEGNIIGKTYKKIAVTGDVLEDISTDKLKEIYENNVLENVQITAMKQDGISSYGSGFFIREGVIATTWSLFTQYLVDANYVYVNDANGNTYEIDGIVAADALYDVVLLKLSDEKGDKVTFGNTSNLKVDDYLFTINSKGNTGFSINYGTFVSMNEGKMQNFFMLSYPDIGSALYDISGNVVGFNTKDSLYSEVSVANSAEYLKEVQNILEKEEFKKIKAISLDKFKAEYYKDIKEEKKYNTISKEVWNRYKKIGNIEENISLELIKASYNDDILSLRYKNDASKSLSSLFLTNDFVLELEKEGFKEKYTSLNKKIYNNDKYKVIIRQDMDYLIVLMMEN